MSNTLNILHPVSRTDRFELLVKQLDEQLITDHRFWNNPIGQSMRERRNLISSGHKKIVQYAKDSGFKKVIIAENDLQFFKLGAWQYYLDNTPEDYDIYFGMLYDGQIENNRLVSKASGFTLYTVHERFYDAFLGINSNPHIDLAITSEHTQYKFMVCDPMVCEQNDTQSDNFMGRLDLHQRLIDNKRNLFGATS